MLKLHLTRDLEKFIDDSIDKWANLSIHMALYKSKVYFETVYFSTSSIDITPGYFNVLVSKRRGEIHRKKETDVMSNRCHTKMIPYRDAQRSALTACAIETT